MSYPKLVALDTDWTIFWGWLDQNTWGKGSGAYNPVEDNITKSDYWEVHDQSNPNNKCGMYADIPRIIPDILKNGAQIAIVSRNKNKAMCDRALWYMRVPDENGVQKPLIDLVKFDEVYDADKIVHFNAIRDWTGYSYYDMILFDDEAINNTVEMMLGVTFQVSRDQKGLTWDNYQQGLAMWRRNKSLMSPFLGNNLDLYPNKRFLGYSGMDIGTIEALEKGWRRRDRQEEARWGYAMYVADDPAVARYFSGWIKHAFGGASAKTFVCQIWARDGAIWDSSPKIWIPETDPGTDVVNWDPFRIAWSQEDRDRRIAERYGVQKPYTLFARHGNMGGDFPVPNNARFNEMVIYGQLQEALLVTIRMSDQHVTSDIQSGNHIRYEQLLNAWNITVPPETWEDFRRHGETWIRR
ncbi:hypothetical protein VKT23_007788 [Stygiomarasmius scandens]|uniref:Uncharacterized protein n=1 Tax=Marasmiellus scandens TaxID=2682957 RepID=A0ABR1JPK0_9AGAR